MRAVESGDEAEVRRLILAGAAPDVPLAGGETALMKAAAQGYSDVAIALLDGGADVNAKREDGFTPLLVATFRGHADVVNVLLNRGADPTAQTRLGSKGKTWALAHGFEDISSLLARAETPRRVAPNPISLPPAQLINHDPEPTTDSDTTVVQSPSTTDDALISDVQTPIQMLASQKPNSQLRWMALIAVAVIVIGGIALYSDKWRTNAPANSLAPTPPVNGAAGVPASVYATGDTTPNVQPSPLALPQPTPSIETLSGATVGTEFPTTSTSAYPGSGPGTLAPADSTVPAVVSEKGQPSADGKAARPAASESAVQTPSDASVRGGSSGRQGDDPRPSGEQSQPSKGQGAEIRTAAPTRPSSQPSPRIVTEPSPSASPKKKVIQWP